MKLYNFFTSLQEVPDNLSLCFSFAGCPHHCKNCSWQNETTFTEYSLKDIKEIINKYAFYVSCVCFLGGEWEKDFIELLGYCKNLKLKTCLYTGLVEMRDIEILSKLDFIKLGPYQESYGGLSNKNTNQVFLEVKTGKRLNHLFVKE